MRPAVLILAALSAAPAWAETGPTDPRLAAEDKARTVALNRRAAAGIGAPVAAAAAQDLYRRRLADYDAARAQNDRDRAAAAGAAVDYARAQAAYRAEIARWRADVAAGADPR